MIIPVIVWGLKIPEIFMLGCPVEPPSMSKPVVFLISALPAFIILAPRSAPWKSSPTMLLIPHSALMTLEAVAVVDGLESLPLILERLERLRLPTNLCRVRRLRLILRAIISSYLTNIVHR